LSQQPKVASHYGIDNLGESKGGSDTIPDVHGECFRAFEDCRAKTCRQQDRQRDPDTLTILTLSGGRYGVIRKFILDGLVVSGRITTLSEQSRGAGYAANVCCIA